MSTQEDAILVAVFKQITPSSFSFAIIGKSELPGRAGEGWRPYQGEWSNMPQYIRENITKIREAGRFSIEAPEKLAAYTYQKPPAGIIWPKRGVEKKPVDPARARVLLEAMSALFEKQEQSRYVLNMLDTHVKYDDADCDGACLFSDIRSLLEHGA